MEPVRPSADVRSSMPERPVGRNGSDDFCSGTPAVAVPIAGYNSRSRGEAKAARRGGRPCRQGPSSPSAGIIRAPRTEARHSGVRTGRGYAALAGARKTSRECQSAKGAATAGRFLSGCCAIRGWVSGPDAAWVDAGSHPFLDRASVFDADVLDAGAHEIGCRDHGEWGAASIHSEKRIHPDTLGM